MDDVKRILVVSRMTKDCAKAVRYGDSLASQCGAELHVLHVFYGRFVMGGWNMPYPAIEDACKKSLEDAKKELDKVVYHEARKGLIMREEVRGEAHQADTGLCQGKRHRPHYPGSQPVRMTT
jgi:hypothetical protein